MGCKTGCTYVAEKLSVKYDILKVSASCTSEQLCWCYFRFCCYRLCYCCYNIGIIAISVDAAVGVAVLGVLVAITFEVIHYDAVVIVLTAATMFIVFDVVDDGTVVIVVVAAVIFVVFDDLIMTMFLFFWRCWYCCCFCYCHCCCSYC